MNISQKCNCCMHEEVCSNTDMYKKACENIVNSFTCKGLVSVSITCKHFKANQQSKTV